MKKTIFSGCIVSTFYVIISLSTLAFMSWTQSSSINNNLNIYSAMKEDTLNVDSIKVWYMSWNSLDRGAVTCENILHRGEYHILINRDTLQTIIQELNQLSFYDYPNCICEGNIKVRADVFLRYDTNVITFVIYYNKKLGFGMNLYNTNDKLLRLLQLEVN